MADARHELFTIRRAFVIILLVVFGWLAYRVFAPFLSYIFLGALFVYLLHPLHVRFSRALRRPRLSAALILVLFTLALLVPFAWVVFEVATTTTDALESFDADAFVEGADATLQQVASLVGYTPDENSSATRDLLNATLPELQRSLQARVPRLLGFAGSFLLGLFIIGFVVYYGLLDGPRFARYVVTSVPLARVQAQHLLNEMRRTIDAVFLGHIIVSAIQGTLGGIGFLLFGIPHAVFWGFVMILLSLLPVVGAPIVWMPAAAWLFFQGKWFAAAGLFIWGALLVSTIDNVLRPKIVGSRARIHPFLVLVGVLGGVIAFGFVGFVLGPLVVSLLVAVLNFWRKDYLPGLGEGEEETPHDPAPPS